MDEDERFVEFVSARRTRLFRLAYLLTAEASAAEDLLQTAMEKTYANWPKVRRMDAPEAYVRKVMVNAVVSARRRPGYRLEWLRPVLPERPTTAEDNATVDHALLWPLVCALPERQRAVVVLRYYEDLTEAQTADVLGCTIGTVKSQAHDAMRHLRRGFGSAHKGEVLER
jgi:RNA polymerase sigma-70 factor (sigma-E family)